jgi:hypothetical protein
MPAMIVRCAWCKADMGTKPCEPYQHGQVSHGMCPACESNWWATHRVEGRAQAVLPPERRGGDPAFAACVPLSTLEAA